MNKAQLINEIAELGELDKKDAAAALDTVVEAITKALKAGEKVQIAGVGTFELKSREGRTGRNPRTGEPIDIPAANYPVFTVSKALRRTFNEKCDSTNS